MRVRYRDIPLVKIPAGHRDIFPNYPTKHHVNSNTGRPISRGVGPTAEGRPCDNGFARGLSAYSYTQIGYSEWSVTSSVPKSGIQVVEFEAAVRSEMVCSE
jgi:hypothetical protein